VKRAQTRVGDVSLELGAAGHGIVSWRLRGVDRRLDSIDGLPTEVENGRAACSVAAASHPNGAVGIDHVVVLTSDFDHTARELRAAGMPLRRVRQAAPGVRQGFRRVGPAILELVEAPEAEPAATRFWGLVVIVADLDALAARLGDQLGAIKPAVQPGRQIATLRRSAGLGEAVAFMSPEAAQPGATLG
jgi:hypothetical protein